MTEKSWRAKIDERMKSFGRLYREFKEDYEKNNEYGNPWNYLFATIPFVSAARDDTSKKVAVFDTLSRLKLNELPLGAIAYTSPQLGLAIDLGKLNVDDLALIYKMPEAKQRSLLGHSVHRFRADSSDPFFWRTLLEIFCRAYVATGGRTPEWTTERTVSLAFDLIEIGEKHLKDNWSNREALAILKREEPYRSKYIKKGKSKLNLKQIDRVMDEIGPLDGDAMTRVKKLYQGAFFEEVDDRFLRASPKTPQDIAEILDQIGQLFDRTPVK
jgi:hypothetical protein